ncbi:hypothetical protein RHSIM_Rhsim05G0080000 [Rhododendron simsii]|uniref:DNA-directed RNA polymerase III subunit RPC6 n=1 Tax=Rhododendron simsii TaxID=118357 RepID=A0A834H8W6_RHOSS|nr:hypothetical protein RHSIM_Rhsim05G0080000 [Rhododendron simsii]
MRTANHHPTSDQNLFLFVAYHVFVKMAQWGAKSLIQGVLCKCVSEIGVSPTECEDSHVDHLWSLFSKDGEQLPRGVIVKMLETVLEEEEVGVKFQTAYVLFALSCFMCPTTKDVTAPRFYPIWMSLSQDAMSLKRKRQEPNAQQTKTPESVLLSLIKSKGDMGIWKADMKRETNLPEPVVNKALKILQGRNLIKEVVNVKSKGRKHYMATEFQPSKEVTGGSWYADGVLDIEYIRVLRESCLRIIKKMKVATTEGISEFITRNKITKADCTRQQIEEILSSMVLDNEIIEVKSTGLGEYHKIPIGTDCYRAASGMGLGQGAKIGAMASIPCGVCPRVNQCTPDGIISPKTCIYYEKWLDF